MRYLIAFLSIYCLVAVLAEIPDGLRRVKRHENAQNLTGTHLQEFSKIHPNDANKSENKYTATSEKQELKDKLENLKDTNAGDNLKDNTDAHNPEKLPTPASYLWHERESHKRQHLNEKSNEKKSTDGPSTMYTYESPFRHSMAGNLAAAARTNAADLSGAQKTRLRHFRQGMPFSYKNRNYGGRSLRNKKKSFGGKRKTVLVLHTPHASKYIAKETPRHMSDDLVKEEMHQLEMDNDNDFVEPLSIFKTHEPKKSATIQQLGYFADVPTFPWELANVENQYTPKTKHLLDPVDNLMKFANMMMYRVGVDGSAPFHTQATHITATPEMVISATATGNNHDAGEFSELEHNIFSNENAHAESSRKLNSDSEVGTTYGTLEFTPPIQLGSHPKEPKKLMNFIENALDTMLISNDDQKDEGDEEIEVHCPIHRSGANSMLKKSNEMDDDDHIGGSILQPKADAMEVCQCHFIKKKKEKH